MRRVWALAMVAAAAVGCGGSEQDEWLGGPAKTEQSLAASGSGGGSSGAGGATTAPTGTSTSAATATSVASTSSSASGSGGSACVPLADACGVAVCGNVDDGCGHPVKCGDCQGTSVCKSGACCYPSMAACNGVCNVDMPDGCGGMIHCDGQCGDFNGLMACSDAGKCECTPVVGTKWEAAGNSGCNPAGGIKSTPYFCGDKTPDAPKGCTGGLEIPGSGLELWCCQ